MTEEKKYYWLKLKNNFFKRHDIRIIKAMPNGKEYVLFYLMLLLESLDHSGQLRFNETIPYDENMLSIITDTNIDVVKSAMKLLVNLELVEVLDDKTIYMVEVDKMLGYETKWAEKKREYKSKKSIQDTQNNQCLIENVGQSPSKVRAESDKSLEFRVYSLENRVKSKDLKIKPLVISNDRDGWFNQFWNIYPKKIQRKTSEQKFKLHVKDELTFNAVMLNLSIMCKSNDWTKDNGQYIPNPTTYLNQRRWEDETKPVVKTSSFLDMLKEQENE